jgi:predicted NBD/HSP70 family sugar kinase
MTESGVKAAVCDYYGRELAFCSRPASNDLAAFFGGELPDLLEEIVRKNRLPKRDILGIGICMPGDFNSDASEVHLGPLSLIKSSERFAALSAAFSKRTRLPVYCYNDVNASAYGEFLQRDGQTRDLVFILAGDGFGSGLILDGKLRLGEHFSAGEVGYLVFDPAFCTDASEPGWFETQLSRDTLTRTFPEFAGGEKRDALLEYLARQIALAVANICNLLDVKLVVLDGDLLNETDGSLREKNRPLCATAVPEQNNDRNSPVRTSQPFGFRLARHPKGNRHHARRGLTGTAAHS